MKQQCFSLDRDVTESFLSMGPQLVILVCSYSTKIQGGNNKVPADKTGFAHKGNSDGIIILRVSL
jgi:hypothetical protein